MSPVDPKDPPQPPPVSIEVARCSRLLARCALDSPAVVYLMGMSAASRPTTAGALRHAANCFGISVKDVSWGSINHGQMVVLRAYLAERFAPSMTNRVLTAVRGVMKVACKLDLMTYEACERAQVKAVPGSRVRPGRSVTAEELVKLFAAAATHRGIVGARYAAALALCYGCGMRRAEACAARLEQLDLDGKAAKLRVIGKGNKERLVYLPDGSRRAVADWLDHRGRAPGFLLCLLRGGRGPLVADPSRKMNEAAVYNFAGELAKLAGVPKFSPHDLRRTYIGDLLDADVDVITVQQLVGHSDPTTTSSYDRRGERTREAAATRINVPYGKPE